MIYLVIISILAHYFLWVFFTSFLFFLSLFCLCFTYWSTIKFYVDIMIIMVKHIFEFCFPSNSLIQKSFGREDKRQMYFELKFILLYLSDFNFPILFYWFVFETVVLNDIIILLFKILFVIIVLLLVWCITKDIPQSSNSFTLSGMVST